jgi:all-trans-8'-apo-beta-carotenal 15,15'-oxygenase
VHDFVLTERYAVFLLPPVAFSLGRALLGMVSPVDALERDPSASTLVLVVPRDGGEPRTLEARPGFAFHHIGGWDEGARELVVDTLRMDDFRGGGIDVLDPAALRRAHLGRAVPTRMVIDLGAGASTAGGSSGRGSGRVSEEVRIDADVELPTTDPRRRTRPSRVAFAIARTPGWPAITHSAVARLDLAERSAVLRDLAPDLPGEPLFVPRAASGRDGAAEGEGWVLTIVYRAREHRSELWVLDAKDLSTVARARLPHHVPPGFHGTFVPRG